jgi:aryl-alcohol dehydrogenase-like predicted oxidoreductase
MLHPRTVTLAGQSVTVTRLGLGLAAVGRPGYLNLGHREDLLEASDVEGLRRRAWALLDAALAAGVGAFDAARSYGLAEEFLAGWLKARGIPPGQLFVSSKWGYRYTAGWQADAAVHEVKEHTLEHFLAQRAETHVLLGDHLTLYQVHSATLDSGLFEQPELLAALATLRDEGVAVGLSVSGPAQGETIKRALAVELDGRRLFESVQATWNLLERSAGPALAEAKAAGLLVIVKEGLANGRLTARNDAADFAIQREILERESTRLGTTPDALALAVALDQACVDIVLSGASTLAQLASNLAATEVKVDGAAHAALEPLVEPPALYWKARAALPWT